MTEVAYGFFEACEDAAYPLAESNQEEKAPFQGQNWMMKNDMVRQFFRAMETVNNSQLEPSESNMSLASTSYNSFSSLASASRDQSAGGLTPANVFGAFQTVALNGSYGSSNSLSGFDASTLEQRLQLPFILQQMLRVFDEFMHNHDNTEDASRSPKDSSNVEFPKFC